MIVPPYHCQKLQLVTTNLPSQHVLKDLHCPELRQRYRCSAHSPTRERGRRQRTLHLKAQLRRPMEETRLHKTGVMVQEVAEFSPKDVAVFL
jgi:hypothetical protein